MLRSRSKRCEMRSNLYWANTVHEPRSPKKDTAPSVPHTTENP